MVVVVGPAALPFGCPVLALYGQSGRHRQVEDDAFTVFHDPYADQPEPIEVWSRSVGDGAGACGAQPSIGTTITICEPIDCQC